MSPAGIEHLVFALLLTFIATLAILIYFLYSVRNKKRRRRGPQPPIAPQAPKSAPAAVPPQPADVLARAGGRFADGLFGEALEELEKIPRPRWGEPECSLALRASLRLNNFRYAKGVFEWAETRGELRDSALLQYLFAIISERAGNAKLAASMYDKLLRINGDYQDCAARLRRLRRLPAEDARTMSVYFETTGRGRSGSGPGRQPTKESPAQGEVAGRFSIHGLLGVGGSGIVFLAKDKSSNRLVALKRMSREISRNPADRALFLAEAKTLSELRHPRIVEFYEAVEYEDEVYLVLEYVDWETLQTVLALRGRLTPGEVVPILMAVAEALAFAHEKKVIHRDLKPGNIIAGPRNFVKVMDFGIARHFDRDVTDTQEVEVVGTPPYMAPEQHAGVTTPLSDIYSFGVTAYTLLTGRLPFAGPSTLYYSQKMEHDYPRLPSGLPSFLRELIDNCLMFDPQKRPASAARLLQILREAKG